MWAWGVRDGALHWGRSPRPAPARGETLVKVALAGVCGSDVAKLTKDRIPDPGYSWRPGHEIVGWDLRSHPERLVAVNPLVPCGRCDRCAVGHIDLCPELRMLGWALPGGFAEYVTVPVSGAVPLPDGLDATHAVLADPTAVAVHGIRCGLGHLVPRRLAVIGSGALAVAGAAYAASIGWDVTLIVRGDEKREALTGTLKASVAFGAPGRHFDAVVDAASGHDDSPFTAALDLVRDGGVIVAQTSYHPGVRLSRDLREPIRRALTITGSFTYCRSDGHDDFAIALDLLAARPSWAARYVGDAYPLADLPQALAALSSGVAGRPFKAVLSVFQEGN